jgi:hypothetical protein
MYGAIPPLSQYAFMAWCSVKAQCHLYFYVVYYKLVENYFHANESDKYVGISEWVTDNDRVRK